jgi:hypothetical protein
MEHVKSAGSLKSIMVNPKRSVVTEEMEHLLKIWLDDQAQRSIPVSEAIISAKPKSPYYDLKKQMGDSAKDELLFSASNGRFNRLKRRASLHNLRLTGRLQVQIFMLPQIFPHSWLN